MTVPSLIYRVGASVGLVGGAVFVLANRIALGHAVATVALVAWAVLACVAVWAVWVRGAGAHRVPGPLAPRAGMIYGLSCLGMLALIQVGTRTLAAFGHTAAAPAVIALAVGLHLLPFRRAFGLPLFTRLGWVVAAIGAVGVAAHLVLGAPVGAGAAVLAGLVMTALITRDALSPTP